MAKTKTAQRKTTKKTPAKPRATPVRKAAVKKAAAKKAPAKKTAARRAPRATTPTEFPSPTLAPYLAVGDAAAAIEWYKTVLGAKEDARMDAPGGKIMHARLRLDDAVFFLSDIFPGADVVDPVRAGTSVTLNVYHKNCDKMWARAVANGAKVTMPIDDMFWGQRYGKLTDPFGHNWALSYRSKLSKAALEKKREEAMKDFASMG